ncbi:multisubunit sodium/proton antiporter, MrpF subunit (TC 2.A.63.1) [Halogeometricum rufum]|jgi:multicomponent Na+:H+ antiporter subunit F|uniref:Multisubunit sodium/proton antiporter, MrpF subunit (TC 2.A.63.1) n=1 Tax=Halogeometricum rufum TaxID=553469 RepID=A0A1I6IKV6_9EURY|nr:MULTISPECIES: monovalent cation/H+ antiporter complex subunit F [Halogeometricum]MUV58495.1 cation:proton antiporter [Halogeometricum sp. CBA1124]SFR67333.1 multisubunit sodium/proton antiporter, MrpF subunit (TC 2.A.63.1) [Halogeometricum rufum]
MTTPVATTGLLLGGVALVALATALLWRVVVGPTTADRVVAVNVVGTTTVVVIALLSAALDEPGFLDVALVYALLNFLLSLGLSRFSVERGGLL